MSNRKENKKKKRNRKKHLVTEFAICAENPSLDIQSGYKKQPDMKPFIEINNVNIVGIGKQFKLLLNGKEYSCTDIDELAKEDESKHLMHWVDEHIPLHPLTAKAMLEQQDAITRLKAENEKLKSMGLPKAIEDKLESDALELSSNTRFISSLQTDIRNQNSSIDTLMSIQRGLEDELQDSKLEKSRILNAYRIILNATNEDNEFNLEE